MENLIISPGNMINPNIIDINLLFVGMFIQLIIQTFLVIILYIVYNIVKIFRTVNVSTILHNLLIQKRELERQLYFYKTSNNVLLKSIIDDFYIFVTNYRQLYKLLIKSKEYKHVLLEYEDEIRPLNFNREVYELDEEYLIEKINEYIKKMNSLVEILSKMEKQKVIEGYKKMYNNNLRKSKVK